MKNYTLSELKENKDAILAEKAAQIKNADAFGVVGIADNDTYGAADVIVKQAGAVKDWREKDSVKIKAVINATNIIDSHMDLHLPKIWDESLKSGARILHLQEHKTAFDSIINETGEGLEVKTENISWKALGFNYEGKSECLVFDSEVSKSRNNFMFEQYAQGFVKNHSVGMRYNKILLCVNDKDDPYWEKEYEAWQKYIGAAVNPERAEKQGYFYAVLSADVLEGSAVPVGSNVATPTMEAKSEKVDEIANENEREIDANKLRARRLHLTK